MGCLIFHAKKWDRLYKYSRDGYTINRVNGIYRLLNRGTNRQQKTVISDSVQIPHERRSHSASGGVIIPQ